MTNLVIADDHQLFVDGLQVVLDEVENIQVIGIANKGEDVFQILDQKKVDLILLDIEMPGIGGIATASRLIKEYPLTKVLVVTTHNSQQFILELMKIGVSGYILKISGKEELINAIYTVAGQGTYFDNEVMKTAVTPSQEESPPKEEIKLTRRELEVLLLLEACKSSKEIADKLFIGKATVETHIRNLLSKLNVANRMYLMRYAILNEENLRKELNQL